MPRKDNFSKKCILVILLVLLCGVYGGICEGPMISVPNVVGMEQVDAEETLTAAHLTVGTISREHSDIVPVNHVINQTPPAGISVIQGTPVDFILSLGPIMVTVPDVGGLAQADAEAVLTNANLTIGVINQEHSNTVPVAHVISQSPLAGDSVAKGSSVNLVVSLGPVMVTVPDVIRMEQGEAESTITTANLIVGTISRENNDTIPADTVISQHPVAGATVAQGTTVDLVISLGPAGSEIPPDPKDVASVLDQSVATSLAAATEFLYTGDNLIQTGMDPGTIEPIRAAVLRGNVITRDGQPLSGVVITILNHSEYGQTLSRADGMFDMAVNGGGLLTVNYRKEGYLSAQRQVNVPWQDYTWLPEVALIPLDTQVTTIDFSESIQVAQGSIVTDENGTRQATLLFQEETTAEMVMPDGSTQPLSSLSVRATEYTVDENGHQAMPAELPPTSGYTYCVEFSADEALAAGAVDVRFDQPIYTYVEDFIGFPVGSAVPTGYYDRQKGQWIASENGHVVKILSITGGLADMDTDGDEAADDSATLAALGITDAERERLAALYLPDQSLWRVPINHFTPWDHNWPYGPPEDAEFPNQPSPENDDPEDNSCEYKRSSIIESQNQILGERIAIVGTPFTLNYRSDRVNGRKAAYSLNIPLSGDTLPESLLQIHLEIKVAGQKFYETFPPQPNLTYAFTWNGQDAYGRTLQGKQAVSIRIGYAYNPVYYPVRSDFGRSFARVSGRSGGGGATEVTTGYQRLGPIVLWQKWEGAIGMWDARAQGLGGWSLDIHHVYNPIAKTLYRGDGKKRRSAGVSSIIQTVAGDGTPGDSGDSGPATEAQLNNPWGIAITEDRSFYIADSQNVRIRHVGENGIITTVAGNGTRGYSGDGGPATEAQLFDPRNVAVAQDGSLYIADPGAHCIRRVGPDGIITTVAGNSTKGYSGDGGPATEAQLNRPYGIAVAADNSFYIADRDNHCIRHIGPDGIITTVAGNGTRGYSGDGGLATEAQLKSPYGIAVAADNSLYIADTANHCVRRVGSDGIIMTIAGTGTSGYNGDGGPATEARLYNPRGVAVDWDGVLYIAEYYNRRIRQIGSDGIITTVAGNGTEGYSGDNGPAPDAQLFYPADVATAPDGSLYIADEGSHCIRQITGALPGVSVANIIMPSEDGSELYHFESSGRHVRTLNALTGTALYQFSYDAAGLLVSVEDGDGNVTMIERDADGTPLAIVGPYGQRTTFNLDAQGYLAGMTNPAGETHQFTYTHDGLLTNMVDPRDNTYSYSYDEMGRLVKTEDPAGGFKELARTEIEDGYEVTLSTAMGRITTYAVERLSTDAKRLVNTFGCCGSNEVVIGTDGSQTITYTDGTAVSEQQGPDPRWGMQSPLLENQTITTPGGLQFVLETERTVSLTDYDDPLSLETLTDTFNINGQTYTSLYDAIQHQLTITSPEGRQSFATIDAQERIIKEQIAGLPYAVHYGYDSHGRLDTLTLGPGNDPTVDRVYSLQYNDQGDVARITDPVGRSMDFAYDNAGRVSVQTFSDGRQIAFTYDLNGNTTSITPPGRPSHSFAYTPVDLLDAYMPPTLSDIPEVDTRYAYNLDRDLEMVTRPDGLTIEPVYDFTRDRFEKINLPDGREIEFVYYDGNSADEPGTGQVKEIRVYPEDVSLTYTYDGSLLTEEMWGGPVQGKVSRTYNDDFMTQSLLINSADFFTAEFAYDNEDLLSLVQTQMVDVQAIPDFSLSRNLDNGLITGTALGGITTTQTYNGFGEPASYSVFMNGNPLFERIYDTTETPRDKLGRITDVTETVEGITTHYHYGYDLAGRLSDVWKNDEHISHYGYDDNGNRISHTNPTIGTGITPADVEYDDQDRLLRYGTTIYTYTPNGELLTKTENGQTTSYNYDVLGNLRAVTLPNGPEIEYIIDGGNRRIGKKVNGELIQGFLYRDDLNPIVELDGNNNVVSVFVYASRAHVPDYMVSKKEDGVTWITYRIISNHLGSPRLVVNAKTGQVVQRLDYDEFGNIRNDTNPGFQPFGFVGGIYDQHTKLTRFGVRDYDAEIGRWTAKDPIMFTGGDANLYGYVFNDPVGRFDLNGMSDLWEKLTYPPSLRDLQAEETRQEVDLPHFYLKQREDPSTPSLEDMFNTIIGKPDNSVPLDVGPVNIPLIKLPPWDIIPPVIIIRPVKLPPLTIYDKCYTP